VTYTLVSDGSSDQVLIPIIDWSIRGSGATCAISSQWADLRLLRNPPSGLTDRVQKTLELYPCDVLFLHRDAENVAFADRCQEIVSEVSPVNGLPPLVKIVPVRMTEAWLLFDEVAIRNAAGNPNGTTPLSLPSLGSVETLPDPKSILRQLLTEATGKVGRRLRSINPAQMTHRVPRYINDFTPLNQIAAFRRFSAELQALIQSNPTLFSESS